VNEAAIEDRTGIGMAGEWAIEVRGLVFEYPGLRALDEVGFAIAAGQIAALVGPNGAGKTTLMRCLAGLATPVRGEIRVAGVDVLEEPRACHRRIGYLSDFYGLYDRLTVGQCLVHAAAAHRIPEAEIPALMGLTATRLNLTSRLTQRPGDLSRGLRQRLAIAQAIIHSPSVLILDEPASGLDPEARHGLAQLFLDLRASGMTLLISSHILAELSEYSTEMLVIEAGRLIEQRPVRAAVAEEAEALCLETVRPHPGLAALLAARGDCQEVSQVVTGEGRTVRFHLRGGRAARHRLLADLLGQGVEICGLGPDAVDLQGSYIQSLRTYRQGLGQGLGQGRTTAPPWPGGGESATQPVSPAQEARP
jgi:ABC-2 type transport system ATP-binding protein